MSKGKFERTKPHLNVGTIVKKALFLEILVIHKYIQHVFPYQVTISQN